MKRILFLLLLVVLFSVGCVSISVEKDGDKYTYFRTGKMTTEDVSITTPNGLTFSMVKSAGESQLAKTLENTSKALLRTAEVAAKMSGVPVIP